MSLPRRIVGDHDVDRLQVEVRQRIEPRSTNHPFGLIPVFGIGRDQERRKKQMSVKSEKPPYGCQRAGGGRKPAVNGQQSMVISEEQAKRETSSPDDK